MDGGQYTKMKESIEKYIKTYEDHQEPTNREAGEEKKVNIEDEETEREIKASMGLD
jgi:hypothetical protein